MIKQQLHIRDLLVARFGSGPAARHALDSWFGTGVGVRDAYNFFVESIGNWPWKPVIWKTCIVPKHRFTLWLVAHGKLLTRDRLGYLPEQHCCLLCHAPVESTQHLFFECSISIQLRNRVRDLLEMKKNMRSLRTVLHAYRNVYRGNTQLAKLRVMALAAMVHQVWNLHNRALFEDEAPDNDTALRPIQITTLRCITR